MKRVIVNDELRAKLNGLDDVELCNPSGEVIGYVLSPEDYKRLILAWADSQTSEEDLKQMSEAKGGRSLAEIWKSLDAQ